MRSRSITPKNETAAAKAYKGVLVVCQARNDDLKLDKLISNYFTVDEINEVGQAMVDRKIKGRWVCKWD